MKHQGDRVAVWESFFSQPDRSRGSLRSTRCGPRAATGLLTRELSQFRVTRILFCMFCIHILLNIIILTVSRAVGLGNELSKSTVIGVYKVIDDMRVCKTKPDF